MSIGPGGGLSISQGGGISISPGGGQSIGLEAVSQSVLVAVNQLDQGVACLLITLEV